MVSATAKDLTEAELWAIERLSHAEVADFNDYPDRQFRASILRCLMLGLPVGPYPGAVPITGPGIRLKHANIIGLLDLEHGAMADGGNMPKLSLEACDIKDGINLKSARIQRLCLKNSRLSELLADHLHINGLLDIRGLHPHPDSGKAGAGKSPQALCRLRLCGAHIADGIDAAGAHLVGPPKNPHYAKYSERSAYALDLPEAQIGGDIRLFPNFVACGGVNINGAVVSGSFQAHGAEFTAAQLYALDACGAVIHGNLALDSRVISASEHEQAHQQGKRHPGAVRFSCEGQIRLHNVIVDEDLRLFGARLYGPLAQISAEHIIVRGDASLCAFDDARGDLRTDDEAVEPSFPGAIFGFECPGRIRLRGANISGDLNFRGATLGGDITTLPADLKGELDISSSHIGGHLLFSPISHMEHAPNHSKRNKGLLQRFLSGRSIKLDSTEIAGNLDMRGARLRGELQAYGLTVKGFANLAPFEPDDHSLLPWRFDAEKVIFDNAVIGQKLDMSGARLKGEFLAPNLQVGGKLLMCGFARDNDDTTFLWFDALKRVNLSGASIKSDFDLTAARLKEGLRFRGGKVDSALIFDIYNAQGNEALAPREKCSIDLFNAHAAILLDLHYYRLSEAETKDDRRLAYDTSYFLRLEGFSYGRFPHYADRESLAASERARRTNLRRHLSLALSEAPASGDLKEKWRQPQHSLQLRKDWLNLQYRGVTTKGWRIPTSTNYNPDPYNTLYKFYKKMGAQEQADRILYEKLSFERKTGNRFRKFVFWPFEKIFGYGLKPIRATAYYLIFIGVLAAIFTLPEMSAAPVLAHPSIFLPGAYVGRVQQAAGVNAGKPCPARTAAQLMTYTFETVVPSFDLGEHRRCDFSEGSSPGWLWFKLVAALLGGLMTSMTLITWSGILRRNLEP